MADHMKRFLAALLLILFVSPGFGRLSAAQQGGTTNFVYDKNGRLHFVILQTGDGARYDYDPAGNMTGIQRFPVGTFLVQISPSTAVVNQGGTFQFTAVIPPEIGSTEATWSVNGIVGGNPFVGTISPTGLYTAPSFFNFSARVRAASTVALNLFAEATVFMTDPNSNPGLVSPVVTVGRSDPVSGQGAMMIQASATPTILSVAPNRLTRESATRLTIRGTKLNRATSLRFVDDKGASDAAITVSNVTVSSDGTSLTAIVKIAAGTALGRRTVVVLGTRARASAKAVGATTVEVVAR